MEATEPTGGAGGEQAAPEAPSSQPSLTDEVMASLEQAPPPAEPAQTPQFDEPFLQKLRSMKPGDLPEDVRKAWVPELEKPFLSHMTTQTTEWDKERQSYVGLIDNLAKRLESTNALPQNTHAQVDDLLAQGDYKAAVDVLKQELRNEITPERQYVSTMVAIGEAKNLMPDLPKYEASVAKALTSDPILMEMSNVNNRRFAGRVLAGIAFQLENQALKAELAQAQATFQAKVRQAIDETQRRIKGLPSSTSRAGQVPHAEPSKGPKSLLDSMEEAWREQMGG